MFFVLTAGNALGVKPGQKKAGGKPAAAAFAVSAADLPTDAQVGRSFSFSVTDNFGDVERKCEVGDGAPESADVSNGCDFSATPTSVGTIAVPVKVSTVEDTPRVVTKTFTVAVHPWSLQPQDLEAVKANNADWGNALRGYTKDKDGQMVDSGANLQKLKDSLDWLVNSARPNTIDLTRQQVNLTNKKVKYLMVMVGLLGLYILVGGVLRIRRARSVGSRGFINFFGAFVLCAVLLTPIPTYAAGLEVKSISPTTVSVGATVTIKTCGTGLSDKDDVDFSDTAVLQATDDKFDVGCHNISAKGLKAGEVKLVVTPDGGTATPIDTPTIKVTEKPAAPTVDNSRREDMRWLGFMNGVCGTEKGKGRCGREYTSTGFTGAEVFARLKAARTQAQEDAVMAMLATAAEFNASDRVFADDRFIKAVAAVNALNDAVKLGSGDLKGQIGSVNAELDRQRTRLGKVEGDLGQLGGQLNGLAEATASGFDSLAGSLGRHTEQRSGKTVVVKAASPAAAQAAIGAADIVRSTIRAPKGAVPAAVQPGADEFGQKK